MRKAPSALERKISSLAITHWSHQRSAFWNRGIDSCAVLAKAAINQRAAGDQALVAKYYLAEAFKLLGESQSVVYLESDISRAIAEFLKAAKARTEKM